MMFTEISQYYDLIYSEKNYIREAECIEKIMSHHHPNSILEVGCGTGNFTKIFSERGYNIVGMDISENMLRYARKKCNSLFVLGDICDVKIKQKFDVTFALFNVFGYLPQREDLIKAFKNIYLHLSPKGILIFDVWNGDAVTHLQPKYESRVFRIGNIEISKEIFPLMNMMEHYCNLEVKYEIKDTKKENISAMHEIHRIRFYSLQEMEYCLKKSHFKNIEFRTYASIRKPNENDWVMIVIAQKE